MGKIYKIEPNAVLSLIVDHDGISIAITKDYEILDLYYFDVFGIYSKLDEFRLKNKIVTQIDKLLDEYSIDMFLLEENKLFIDKIDKYPDPYVLSNILLKYSIQITLEDRYIDKIKYFMEIPIYEWIPTVLNRKARYAIDLFKSHILNKSFSGNENLKSKLDTNNFYKVLCLSECLLYNKLINKKYQINYERGGKNEEE